MQVTPGFLESFLLLKQRLCDYKVIHTAEFQKQVAIVTAFADAMLAQNSQPRTQVLPKSCTEVS